MQVIEKPPKRKRRHRRMSGTLHRKRKKQLVELYGLTCYWCHKPLTLENSTMDHFIPLCEGGRNKLKNLRIACAPCNQSRHASKRVAALLYYRTLMENEEIIRNYLSECRQESLLNFVEFLDDLLASNGLSLTDLRSALNKKTQQKGEEYVIQESRNEGRRFLRTENLQNQRQGIRDRHS